MRIISGTHRGSKLSVLETNDTRPTSDRVKEGLFSAIQFDIPGSRVLDLFAGSGQLGIEALSRGAVNCVFIDSNPLAVEIIKKNLTDLKLMKQSKVAMSDAFDYLGHAKDEFDIVLIDAPYYKELVPKALAALEGRLSSRAVIVCEHELTGDLPETIFGISLYKTYKYGKIKISVYR